jgi:hypothetical protein
MIIDPVLKTGKALAVSTRLAFKHNRTAIWKNQAVPDQQDAALAEADIIVVLTNDPCSLRDQKNAARRAIINILRHLGCDLARKIGTDSGNERCRNHRTRLQNIGRGGSSNAVGGYGAFIRGRIQKCELTVLRGWCCRLWRKTKIGQVWNGRRSCAGKDDIRCRMRLRSGKELGRAPSQAPVVVAVLQHLGPVQLRQ